MFATSILLVVISFLIVKWYRDRKYKQEIFRRMGVPGPTPTLFLGNIAEIGKKGLKYAIKEWTEKYGIMFGYFEGEQPVLVVGETDFVKQVTIKEFHKFHSHKTMPISKRGHEKRNIFDSEGDAWKRLRSITSPTFTAKRMKEMSPLIHKSVDDLLDLFDKKCKEGKAFNIHREFSRLTMDVISSCAFGIDTGSMKDENSKFLLEAKKAFDVMEKAPMRMKITVPICLIFPGIMNFIRRWTVIDDALTLSPNWILDMARKVLMDRKKNPPMDNRVDLLKLLLEGKKHGAHEEADELLSYPGSDPYQSYKPLTDDEIVAQMTIVMLAGYETTSTALGFTAYELALNPHVQKKLQVEIDEYFPEKNIRPDYATVHKLPYLEAVMKEILRFYPIAPIATSRRCFEETKLGDITVTPGMSILLNMDDLHFRPELWGKHDPKKFKPERFLEDCQDAHNKMAWIPFGVGPRICLGMRFAQMEYKIALVRTLKTFSFKKCSETKVPLPTKKNGMFGPSEGVYVTVERRQ